MLALIFVSSLTLSLWGPLWGLSSRRMAPWCSLRLVILISPLSFCR